MKAKEFLLAGCLIVACATCNAASAYEACSVMMGKLSTIYSVTQRGFTKDSPPRINPVRSAESAVEAAFATIKPKLDKRWPGLFDFSSQLVLQARSEWMSPETFEKFSMLKCIERFDHAQE